MKNKLVWIMLGSWGTQIMLVANDDDDFIWGWKWRDQGRKWTNRTRVSKARVKGAVTEQEMGTAKVKRALAALKDQLGIVEVVK